MKISALFEGLSPILFHTTSSKSVEMILRQNEFRLSTDLGHEHERKFREGKGNVYYLSTSRSKTGSTQGRMDVTLVLDGRKLGNTYKGKAIDYFSQSKRMEDPQSFEHEDRVFSPDPTIPNAIKYIKEIHMINNGLFKTQTKESINSTIRKVIILAKKHKIPYYVYDDQKAYLLQNKKKALPISDLDLSGSNVPTFIPRAIHRRDEETMKMVLDLYHKRSMKELSRKTREEMPYLFIPSYGAHEEMSTIFNNARVGEYKGKSRQYIEKITAIMKKEKTPTIRELYDLLKMKWERIQRIEKEMKR